MPAAALALLVAAVAFALADRGGGMNLAEQQTEAERIISAQMVGYLKQEDTEYSFEGARCSHRQDGRGMFECHAWASSNSTDSSSGNTTVTSQSDMLMSIVVCDENGCTG